MEIVKKLEDIGYTEDFNLSNIIDWIRNTKHFNIWVEHGSVKKIKTHDVTTDLGCHRGSYKSYEEAQLEGIKIFLLKNGELL